MSTKNHDNRTLTLKFNRKGQVLHKKIATTFTNVAMSKVKLVKGYESQDFSSCYHVIAHIKAIKQFPILETETENEEIGYSDPVPSSFSSVASFGHC